MKSSLRPLLLFAALHLPLAATARNPSIDLSATLEAGAIRRVSEEGFLINGTTGMEILGARLIFGNLYNSRERALTHHTVQFSTTNPGTSAKSASLLVTITAPTLSAWAANILSNRARLKGSVA